MYWMISFCITIDWLSNAMNQYYQVGIADLGRRPENMFKAHRGAFVMTFLMFMALQVVTLALHVVTPATQAATERRMCGIAYDPNRGMRRFPGAL